MKFKSGKFIKCLHTKVHVASLATIIIYCFVDLLDPHNQNASFSLLLQRSRNAEGYTLQVCNRAKWVYGSDAL